MNAAKIRVMVLLGLLFMLVIAPVASAQFTPAMLGDKWFKARVSWKGYHDYQTDEITGTASGVTQKIYIYTSYNSTVSGSEYYTLKTCSSDKGGAYQPHITDLVYLEYIYGDSRQKQVWDFYYYSRMQGHYLEFNGGSDYTYYTVPVLAMDVKLDNHGAFKSAKFKSVACLGDFVSGEASIVGSCDVSGETVDASKVPQAVKDACP